MGSHQMPISWEEDAYGPRKNASMNYKLERTGGWGDIYLQCLLCVGEQWGDSSDNAD